MDADGPLLLKEDVAEGLTFHEGKVYVNNGPGLGVHFWEEKRTKNLQAANL
jgi:hypothetical protein